VVNARRELKHPHVLQFLGCYFTDPHFYLVTELVEGPDGHNNLYTVLRDRALRDRMISWPLRMRMLHDIATAVCYLHSRGVLHRDLKASNVLVNSEWRCKIADFGLSRFDLTIQSTKAAPAQRAEASVVSLPRTLTRKYNVSAIIPPEVMHGERYDEKVDVFSFGLLCVYCTTHIEAESVPRVKFGISGKNRHAHIGIGAVDTKKLQPSLDAAVAGARHLDNTGAGGDNGITKM
jgi:LIM domain kinase 1